MIARENFFSGSFSCFALTDLILNPSSLRSSPRYPEPSIPVFCISKTSDSMFHCQKCLIC